MMRNKVVVWVLGLVWVAGPVLAVTPDYCADMSMRSASGNVEGKICASGQKLRYEMGPMTTITRLDLKKSYVLMHEQKMYMENPIDPTTVAQAGMQTEGDVKIESLGQENVEGQSAEKMKFTVTSASGTQVYYEWMDQDELPVKIEAEDASWSVVYRNRVVGGVTADMFELPADYQSFAMPDISKMMEQAGQ